MKQPLGKFTSHSYTEEMFFVHTEWELGPFAFRIPEPERPSVHMNAWKMTTVLNSTYADSL